MQSADTIVDTFNTSTRHLLQALEQPDFYIELLMIGIAVAVAVLSSVLIQRMVRRNAQGMVELQLPGNGKIHVPHDIFMKPLKLLPPLLSLVALDIVLVIADAFVADDQWILTAKGLAKAWLLVSVVLMLVNNRGVAFFISGVIILGAMLHATGLGHSVHTYLASLAIDFGKFQLSVLGIIHGIIIFVVVFWLAGVLSGGLEGSLRRSSRMSYNARELILQFFRVFVYSIAVLVTLNAMGVDLTALAVFGGALGVGVGLGLQKITANFVSGVTLLLEKSVKIGDLIEVGGNTGWVRQLHTRYALIETFDGREVLVPNEELISSRVTNWTYSNAFARIELTVPVTYGSDAKLARQLMLEAVMEHPKFLKHPEPTCWLREFGDNGLKFLLTFWIPDIKEGRSAPQSEVMFAIMDKFAARGIKMPQPGPQDLILRNTEGLRA